MIREALAKAAAGTDLGPEEARGAMEEIMSGQATPAQIGGLLVALRAKGETVEEITAFARVMRQHAVSIHPRVRGPLLDTCGTGGDRVKTFNISTAAAFVVAGAGVPVAKHGNRSVTSRCGSADLMEALGVNLSAEPPAVERSIEEAGIGFLFAPRFHPAMKHAGPVRKELGLRTVFNLLGPLTNPAGATAQVVGVYEPPLTATLARVLAALGTRRAYVVHGMDGLDEVSTLGATRISEARDGRVRTQLYQPKDFGAPRATPAEVAGAEPPQAARTLLSLLRGAPGPLREMVLANAAVALRAADRATTWSEGRRLAAEAIDTGAALQKVRALVTHTGGDTGRLRALEAQDRPPPFGRATRFDRT
ncbi:MAG: anthranilate phosphoribosyltransferase [Euryarchaeota archaeon]|nr:anthranilate phosphoribosyltransferase [Euryarchaeota archaeon]